MELDEKGWRIPKTGTNSRAIYHWVRKGKPVAWIAARLKMPVDTVHVLIHRFKHPVAHNKWAAKSYHKRKKASKA